MASPSPASSPACVPPDPSATTIQCGSARSWVRNSSTAVMYAAQPIADVPPTGIVYGMWPSACSRSASAVIAASIP